MADSGNALVDLANRAHDREDVNMKAIRDKEQQNLTFKIAPLRQQLAADQERLKTLVDSVGQPKLDANGKHADYDMIESRMAKTIGDIRQAAGDKVPSDHPGRMAETVNGIRQWLKMGGKNKQQLQTAQTGKVNDWRNQNTQMASQASVGALPFEQTAQGQAEAVKSRDAQALENQRTASAENLEKMRLDFEREKEKNKPSKGLKALEQGGVAYGIENQDTGQQYLPSQLGVNGDAPPEAKQIWQTIKQAQAEKLAQQQKKEDESAERQARTIAAGFERMGQSEQFQELMAQYRSDLGNYRSMNTLADNSEATVQALESQYNQPGNHAVADNELQNFYTTVVQKGGRKTAAELNLTLKIGSWGLNMQQMAKKAASGELPDQLRKDLLAGMKAVAAEQRSTADRVKPELPQIRTPEGPKTRDLKNKKSGGNLQYDPKTGTVH